MKRKNNLKKKATSVQTKNNKKAASHVMMKSPRVVLDRQIVKDFLRQQEQNQNQTDSSADVISLIDSSGDEHEKSVVFVGEEKPPEITPKTECERLRKENKNLKHRIRKIEIHVEALQKRIIHNDQLSAEPIEIDPNETAPAENISNVVPADLNISFDNEWAINQIGNIQDEGNFTMLAAELAKYMENVE